MQSSVSYAVPAMIETNKKIPKNPLLFTLGGNSTLNLRAKMDHMEKKW